MRRRMFLGFLGLGWFIISCSSYGDWKNRQVQKDVKTYRLGNKKIKIIKYDLEGPGVVWFNMHDDENTSVRAAKKTLRKGDGILAELKHPGGRNIRFRLRGETYAFDPNRIYTPAGRKATLEKFGRYSPQADSLVAGFSALITDSLLQGAKIVIALHNNTRGKYSILRYLPGEMYEKDASKVFVHPAMDPDDFFYVTDSLIFEKLKERNQNVLLQNNDSVTDDGSLSVYCGKKGIPYVNIEAQRGHKRVQMQMIETLKEVLREVKE